MYSINPNYAKLASRIVISNHQKSTSSVFSDVIKKQFPNHKTLDQIYYQRLQDNAYQWWFLVWERKF